MYQWKTSTIVTIVDHYNNEYLHGPGNETRNESSNDAIFNCFYALASDIVTAQIKTIDKNSNINCRSN